MTESSISTCEKKHWGLVWLDEDGTANFRFHVSGGGFLPAREALKKFVGVIQSRIDDERNCPYYEEDETRKCQE